MSTNWDFRRILSLKANGQCEGTAVTVKDQPKCKKPINQIDWSAACQLLDQMDRSGDIRDAIDDLEELAGLLLCNEWHNSLIRPQNSQVSKMYNKWRRSVIREYLRLRDQEEREAERVTQREREAAMERQAAREREAARQAQREAETIATAVMTELKKEQLETVRATSPASVPYTTSDIANIDDPFVIQEASSSRPNIFTKCTPVKHIEGEEEEADNVFSSEFPPEEHTELSVREGKRPVLPDMSSPPTHEPSSPSRNHRIAIAEQQETASVSAINSETSSLAKFAFEFGSNSARQVPTFEFETPTKFKIIQGEILPSSGTTAFTAFSGSGFSTSASSTSTTPEKESAEEPKRTILKEKEVTSMDVVLESKFGPPTYEFGSGAERQFEFEAPITPRKPSVPSDSSTLLGLLFQPTPMVANNPGAANNSSQHSKPLDQPDLAFSAPINEPQANEISQPITSAINTEESFGYANITPNSTRYTTYLPARQQHGLITPPETPEMLVGALARSMGGAGYFRDERPRETGSPDPKISRKPLPRSPPPRAEEGGLGREDGCAACGRREGQEVGDCDCGEIYGEEVERPSGCLGRFGFRRLKEKFEGKLVAVRVGIAKRKEKEFPG